MPRQRSSNIKIVALTLVLLVAAAGCSSDDNGQSANGSSENTETDVRNCETSDLTASVAGADASADQRTVSVRLTNSSQSPCSISGAPEVTVVSDRAGDITTAQGATSDASVVVQAGNAATFDLSFPTNGTQNCTKGDRLTITPPGQSSTLLLPLTLDEIPAVCGDSPLSSSPVRSS